MSDPEKTPIQGLIEDLDLDELVNEVDRLDVDSRYSWKLERYHAELARIHPSLGFLAEHVESVDRARTGEVTGDAYRGAALALLAFARVSMAEADNDDTTETFIQSAANPSFSKILRELTAEGAEAVFTRAMHLVRIQARSSGMANNEVIASEIQTDYPGVHSFIAELSSGDKNSEDYNAGLAAGAGEMFLLLRELAGNEDIRRAAEAQPSE